MAVHYVQCEMQKKNETMVAWIPSGFAREGKYLELCGDNGWKVVKTHSTVDYDITQACTRWGLNLPKGQRTER